MSDPREPAPGGARQRASRDDEPPAGAGAPPSPRAREWQEQRAREDRTARIVAVCFLVATAAAIGLLGVYVAGGNAQAEGVLLFLLFGAIGLGLGLWVRRIVGSAHLVEERYPAGARDRQRQTFDTLYREALGETVVGGRRRFLLRLLAGAGAALGVALLVPLRSLGPGPRAELFRTSWAPGRRLVGFDGTPVRASDVAVDQVLTVFPEGAVGSADSQALLIGLREDRLVASALGQPTVEGMVCYSKICTHAGCPVGLYRAAVGELLCPCHQSTFDVNRGAKVLSGPAGRPLPQLGIGVDDGGFLVALGDFEEPVGPSFWNMSDEPPSAGDTDEPPEAAEGDA